MPSLNQIKGRACENFALKYFQNQGYELIFRNVSIGNVEVDLVLKKDQTYFIVEVKSDNLWRMEHPLPYKQLFRLKKATQNLSEASQSSARLIIAFVKGEKIQIYPLDEE